MRRLREESREAHGRDPDDRHVAAALGIDHTKVRALGRAAREVASLDASALLRGGPRKGSGAAERFAPRAADLLADETQAPERHADAALADRCVREGLVCALFARDGLGSAPLFAWLQEMRANNMLRLFGITPA